MSRILSKFNSVYFVKLFILAGVFLLSFSAYTQNKQESIKEQEYVESFLKENKATESEKIGVQCELSLLYYQYQVENKEIGEELANSFRTVLNTYRKSKTLDTSQRLFDPFNDTIHSHSNHPHREIDEVHFVYSPKDKPNSSGNNYEKTSTCNNSDLESGNFDDWQMAWGTYSSSGLNINNIGPNMGAMNGTTGQHAIMGPGAGMDGPSGNNVPRVYPGGGIYSLRLGDQGTGRRAARATYTFTVTPQTELFLYHYAVVMQDPGHSPSAQPFMSINLKVGNVNDPCGYYYQAASSNAPGYFNGTGNTKYKPWETVSISLTNFMGQVATIEFITADCTASGHYGYAYIDAECLPMPTLNQTVINCFTPTPTVQGPPGALSYQWSGPGIIGATNTQNIQVNQPGTYLVTVIPVSGVACAYSIQAIVTEALGTVTADFSAIPDQMCLGQQMNFQSTFTTTGNAGAIDTISWDYGDGIFDSVQNPDYTFSTPGIYPVELFVQTENGCRDSITKNVTIFPIPVADFSVDSVCEGLNSNLVNLSTVLPDNGDVINSWQWDFGDGNTSASQNPNLLYAGQNSYNITLIVESNNGCKDTITKSTIVYPIPVVDFLPTEVCLNDTTIFTDLSTVSSVNTPNNVDNWEWDFADGTTGNSQNPLHAYLNEGVYNVSLTATSDNGCSATQVLPVSVFPNPVAGFLPVDVCLQAATVFTDASTVSNNATTNNIISWDWDFDDGSNSNIQNPSHSYLVEGLYDVVLTVMTDHGCIDVDTTTVTVLPNPIVDFSIDSVCQGINSSFIDLSTINTDNNNLMTTWLWDFGDGQTSTSQSPSHIYNDENLYNVTLTVTSNKGCVGTATKTTAIYPNPDVNFSATDVCFEYTTVFTDLSSVSNNNTSNQIINWDWDLDDGTITNIQSPTHDYASDGVYNVSLTLTTNHDCVSTSTVPVNVYPKPTASFTGLNLIGCSPICPSLTSTSTVGSPSTIDNYEWILSNGTTYSGVNPNFTDCYTNKTDSSVSYGLTLNVTTDKGCKNQHTEPNYITIHHNPIAEFYYTPLKPDIVDSEVSFFNISRYADGYIWNIDGMSPLNEENPVIFFDDVPKTYGVQLIAFTNEGCMDTLDATVKVEDKVIFYVPNTFTPDKDEFNEMFLPVFSSGYDPQTYSLYIYNRWGELLFESHDVNKGWDGTYGVNENKIVKEGTYIWKMTFKETMTDKRHVYSGHITLLR